MKKLILLLIVSSVWISSCDINTVEPKLRSIIKADDRYLNDSTKYIYVRDASRLALRDMKEFDKDYLSSIEISKKYLDNYYNGLIHIYNSRNIPEADSISKLIPIHTFPKPMLNQLIVRIDKDSTVFEKLRNNKKTGIIEFDSFIEKHKLIAIGSDRNYQEGYILLRTDMINNLDAVSYELMKFSFIANASQNIVGGDGSDITAEIFNDKVVYLFTLKWGDCPAGCTGRRTWKLDVYFNGAVKFKESRGLPIPKRL